VPEFRNFPLQVVKRVRSAFDGTERGMREIELLFSADPEVGPIAAETSSPRIFHQALIAQWRERTFKEAPN